MLAGDEGLEDSEEDAASLRHASFLADRLRAGTDPVFCGMAEKASKAWSARIYQSARIGAADVWGLWRRPSGCETVSRQVGRQLRFAGAGFQVG